MENMIIKIKLPKDAHDVLFECPHCDKTFSSGKGLGGHKRVHLEKINKRTHQSMVAQDEAAPSADDQETGGKTPFSCPVCQQCFPSEKSLHGHMRKHPNRGWRGMKPPPAPPTPVEEEEAMAPCTDIVPVVVVDKDDAIAAVANDLIALSNSQPPPTVQDSVSSQDSVMGKANNSLFVGRSESSHNNPNKAHKPYVCDICGKPFKTYHAMGGHKSHHGPGDDKSPLAYMEQPEGVDDHTGLQPPVVDGGGAGGGEEENGKQPKLEFSIDLNELPPSDDDTN